MKAQNKELLPGQEVRLPELNLPLASHSPWLQSAREGLKVCGECDGRGRLRRRRCPACLGSGQYSYDGAGARVTQHKGKWVRT